MTNLNKLTRKELLEIKRLDFRDSHLYESFILLPRKIKHDSGYGCFDIILVDSDENIIGRYAECSDILVMEVLTKCFLKIDLLFTSKCFRLFTNKDRLFRNGVVTSTFYSYIK